MDKGSYTFQALSTKYEDFRGPAFLIKINDTALNSAEMPIASLEVELSADGSAGGCHFAVESLYDFAQSKWINNLAKTIQVGAKLEVTGGYVKQEPLFYGYVDEFSMEYSGSAPPRLSVTGVDGFGFLMSCQEPIYGGKKKPQKVVEDILTKAVSAGYAKSKTVGNLTGFDYFTVGKGHRTTERINIRDHISLVLFHFLRYIIEVIAYSQNTGFTVDGLSVSDFQFDSSHRWLFR